MPKIQDLTGQTFGIWNVIKKTNKRSAYGNTIYLCLNSLDNKKYFKSSDYLIRFKKRNSKSTQSGRPRKWKIIKKKVTKTIVVKVPVKQKVTKTISVKVPLNKNKIAYNTYTK
ncbi:MAG: hypothetical protein MJ223_02875 [Mycoplasmoidaceae bacterium]|nr:hypothetical protein [Mycoplasmoidaceae bacterium]